MKKIITTRLQRLIEDVTGITRFEKPVTSLYADEHEFSSDRFDHVIPEVHTIHGKKFALMKYDLSNEKGELSFEKTSKALKLVAAFNGLEDKPRYVFMVPSNGKPVTVHVSYEEITYDERFVNVQAYVGMVIPQSNTRGGFCQLPIKDIFWQELLAFDEPYSPIIVVDDVTTIRPLGENIFPEYEEPKKELPYPELQAFAGKIYDGSLNKKYPELEEFTGMRFGFSESYAYYFTASHQGEDLGLLGSRGKLPLVGEEVGYSKNIWEIIGVRHKKFKKKEDYDTNQPYFMQYIVEDLKFIMHKPELTDREKANKVYTDDVVKFATLAAKFGFEIEAIKPQYYDKSPVTPWYRCYDELSGTTIIMGWRWRVNELTFLFGKPVDVSLLDNAFGDTMSTKGRSLSIDKSAATSFMIHAHSEEDTEEYFSTLVGIARSTVMEPVV